MMIPATYGVALLLTIVTMVCWGSWANTVKFAKWRFELYYFDFSIGMVVAAFLAAVTFGSIENAAARTSSTVMFTTMENFYIASRLRMAFAVAGGVVFNLANMLLVGAIAVAGMSVAFPIGIGLALIVGVILTYAINPQGRPELLFGGVIVMTAAIVACASAYRSMMRIRDAQAKMAAKEAAEAKEAAAKEAAAKEAAAHPGVRHRTTAPASRQPLHPAEKKAPSSWRGIILSLISGLLMGSFFPLVEMSKQTEFGVGPYLGAVLFGLGVLVSTPLFNLFFMNLPVQGTPINIKEYFKGTIGQHLWGLLGGITWMIGAVANFVAASTPKEVNVGPAISYGIGQGATLVSTLWGLLYWKEFQHSGVKARQLIMLTLALFLIGLVMIAIAPLF